MWKAAIWDKPRNGTRYYVRRDGEAAPDARGGVLTFGSRETAEAHARILNARE